MYIWSQKVRPSWPTERPDIDTYSLVTTKTAPANYPHAVCISPDWKYLYIYAWYVYCHYLSDWTLNTYSSTASSTTSSTVDSRWLFFKDENTIYSLSDSGTFLEISMSNYDLTNSTVTTLTNNIGSGKVWCEFNPDGTKFYCVKRWNAWYEYGLSTAYNPNTSTLDYTLQTSSDISSNTYCIRFSPTGKKVFISNRASGTNNKIIQYECSTPRDLSTAVYSNKSLTLWYGCSFDVSDNGDIFTVPQDGQSVYQYSSN